MTRTKRPKLPDPSDCYWREELDYPVAMYEARHPALLRVPPGFQATEFAAWVQAEVAGMARRFATAIQKRAEDEAESVPKADRALWWAERGPTPDDVTPDRFARWPDLLPIAPNAGRPGSEGRYLRFQPGVRGVQSQLSMDYARSVTLMAVDSRGLVLAEARVSNDPQACEAITRAMWDLLRRADPQPSDALHGVDDNDDDDSADAAEGWKR